MSPLGREPEEKGRSPPERPLFFLQGIDRALDVLGQRRREFDDGLCFRVRELQVVAV